MYVGKPKVDHFVWSASASRSVQLDQVPRKISEEFRPIGGKVHQIAVRDLPRSGRPDELIDKFGLSAAHIVDAVKSLR